MRLKKVWIVARKEMAEFRSNKYVILSLLLVPLTLALLLPFTLILPLASSAPANDPLPLDPPVDTILVGETLNGQIVVNASVENSVIIESVVRASRITNSTLVGVTVEGSILERVILRNSLVRNSNVIDPQEVSGSSLVNSPTLGGEDAFEQAIALVLDSFLLFFVIIPAAIPALLASYSFVGEKLSKSLEPLLATPTRDEELLVGKSFSIFLPTMGATWFAAALFIILVDLLLQPILGYAPLPTATWIVAIAVIAPLFCILSIAANVIVSSRVNDVRASQQLGALVILPVLFLFMLPLFGFITLGLAEIFLFAGGLMLADGIVGFLALQLFQREKILVSWK